MFVPTIWNTQVPGVNSPLLQGEKCTLLLDFSSAPPARQVVGSMLAQCWLNVGTMMAQCWHNNVGSMLAQLTQCRWHSLSLSNIDLPDHKLI